MRATHVWGRCVGRAGLPGGHGDPQLLDALNDLEDGRVQPRGKGPKDCREEIHLEAGEEGEERGVGKGWARGERGSEGGRAAEGWGGR